MSGLSSRDLGLVLAWDSSSFHPAPLVELLVAGAMALLTPFSGYLWASAPLPPCHEGGFNKPGAVPSTVLGDFNAAGAIHVDSKSGLPFDAAAPLVAPTQLTPAPQSLREPTSISLGDPGRPTPAARRLLDLHNSTA